MAASRKLLLQIALQTAQAVKEMERMKGQMKSMADHTKHMGTSMFNAQVAFAAFKTVLRGVTQFLGGSINKFIEQEKAEAQLGATLKSTNNVIGLTAAQLKEMAKGLQSVTAYSDETIIGAENLLLTFTNIGKDVFPQALETVLDMSTALGQDLKSSSIQLGKALQDPILGVTALRRVGVNFNEEAQKMIKNLVDTGRAGEAQAYILKELQTEFGGSARAARETLGGALAALKNSFGDLQESLGAKFAPIIKDLADNLLPKLEGPFGQLGDALTSILGALTEILPTILEMAGTFAPIIESVMNLAVALFDALKPAFEQIVRIIDILAPIIDKLLKAITPLVEIFGDVFATALELVAEVLEAIAPLLETIFDILGPIFEAIKPVVKILGDVLKPILELILLPITELIKAIKSVIATIDDSLHHWENLAKANAQAIEGLTAVREEYQKMESAIKSGSEKQSTLLKTQKELVEKYPELRNQIDLVNGSYEDNVNTINNAIKKRKEEQIFLLEQTQKEIAANKKRAESWLWLNQINQVINPVAAQLFTKSLEAMGNKVISLGDDIKIAKKELKEFNDELANPPKPPKPKPKTKGAAADVPLITVTDEKEIDRIKKAAKEFGEWIVKNDEIVFEDKKGWLDKFNEYEAEKLEKRKEVYKQWAEQVLDSVGNMFSSMGEALASGEDAWKAFAKAGIEAIAGILESLGEQAFAEAAIKFASSIWPPNPAGIASAAASAAAGAAAFVAAGLVRGFAGSFAEGASFRTNGPTMMMVGDNPSGAEDVTITPVGKSSGGGITQPIIIQINSTPIYKGLLKATKDKIALVDQGALV